MNWDAIDADAETQKIMQHWQKLGQFRANHMAVGAGKHQVISEENGLVFSRVRNNDQVVIGIDVPKGNKEIEVATIFKNGTQLHDFYSKQTLEVKDGKVVLNSDFDMVLLEKK